jgi:hypothetical protein
MRDTLWEIQRENTTAMRNVARGATFILCPHHEGLVCYFEQAEKAAPHLIGISVNAQLGDGVSRKLMPQLIIPQDKCAVAIQRLSTQGSVALTDRRSQPPGSFGAKWYLLATIPHLPVDDDEDLIGSADDNDLI